MKQNTGYNACRVFGGRVEVQPTDFMCVGAGKKSIYTPPKYGHAPCELGAVCESSCSRCIRATGGLG